MVEKKVKALGLRSTALPPNLASKYAERPWSDTMQLVRRCMERIRNDNQPCAPIIRCIQKIQEELKGSHLSPTETACYLTADLFYLEVLLQPDGGVEDVKLAQHGEAPVSSLFLLQLLRMKKFEEFSCKLKDLASLYNIPGDSEVKIKVYTAFQFMEKDLLKMSHLPRLLKGGDHVDLILHGRVGSVILRREGSPMSIQYYISPTDILKEMSNPDLGSSSQVALVTVGASETSHPLAMESLIPSSPPVDPQGVPVFKPRSEATWESLAACFLLKLQPPVAMFSSFIHKLSHITDVVIPEADLQWASLPHLLMKMDPEESTSIRDSQDNKDVHSLVFLPDSEVHSYVLFRAEHRDVLWKGALIHRVPFTHPAHVPPLLELLRHQSAINILLASCITSDNHNPESHCHVIGEVTPESDTSFSVTFHLRGSDTLAVLLVTVPDGHQASCRLLSPGYGDHTLDEYISRVLRRCMSIPITMRAIRKRLASLMATVVTSTEEKSTIKTETEPLKCPHQGNASMTTTIPVMQPTDTLLPDAMVDGNLPSHPAYYVMSVSATQAVDGPNTEAVAKPSQCASVGVYSHWTANGLPSELM